MVRNLLLKKCVCLYKVFAKLTITYLEMAAKCSCVNLQPRFEAKNH